MRRVHHLDWRNFRGRGITLCVWYQPVGMDPRYAITPEDLYNLQMEVKQVQYAQSNHAERITRLEKRQADDAAIKSVWNSPFPGVLSGTPQHGKQQSDLLLLVSLLTPVPSIGPVSQNDVFDDLDEQGDDDLLGSLHLGPAEEEPARRGAASRANSVRFDESALHGSSWTGHNSRHSGEFAPTRPGSGLMMERTLSHKSDGRHSSAGHSIHSHHSVASGRASSLGLDTNFAADDDDDSSLDIPGPPPSFFILGAVPSIVRCWLTPDYAHSTLLYADVCTGSQRSTLEYSLVNDLGLMDEVQRGVDGICRIRLSVYLAEAVVVHHSGRSPAADLSVPFISVTFELTGVDNPGPGWDSPAIRIYIGSDALRAHSADVMFSRSTLVLYADDRSRLRVPFVRPEDEAAFRYISTRNSMPEKPRLNANAAPFVVGEAARVDDDEAPQPHSPSFDDGERYQRGGAVSPTTPAPEPRSAGGHASASDTGGEAESERSAKSRHEGEPTASDTGHKHSNAGIWGSWRHGGGPGGGGGPDGQRETGPLSGYQPAARNGRSMKVLRPQKSSSARTGASYEPPPPTNPGREGRRKSQASSGGDQGSHHGGGRRDGKRAVSSGSEAKSSTQGASRDSRNAQTLPRSANPVGGASAFSWMAPPPGKPKTSAATAQ